MNKNRFEVRFCAGIGWHIFDTVNNRIFASQFDSKYECEEMCEQWNKGE